MHLNTVYHKFLFEGPHQCGVRGHISASESRIDSEIETIKFSSSVVIRRKKMLSFFPGNQNWPSMSVGFKSPNFLVFGPFPMYSHNVSNSISSYDFSLPLRFFPGQTGSFLISESTSVNFSHLKQSHHILLQTVDASHQRISSN